MEVFPGHSGRGAGMFLRLKGRGIPQRAGWLKRRSWCRCPGCLGTPRAFLRAVAAVPALHSESLCWTTPAPVRKGKSTIQKAWASGPQRLAAVYIWNKLSLLELASTPVTLQAQTTCFCDFSSELKACLPFPCPAVHLICQ